MSNSPIEVRAESADFQNNAKRTLYSEKKKKKRLWEKGRHIIFSFFLLWDFSSVFISCTMINLRMYVDVSSPPLQSRDRMPSSHRLCETAYFLFIHRFVKTKFKRHTHTRKQVCALGENSVVSALFLFFFLMQQNLKAQRFQRIFFFLKHKTYIYQFVVRIWTWGETSS